MNIHPTSPASKPLPSIEKAILTILRQGERNRGQLSDLMDQPYSLLVPALDVLLSRGLIESYFDTAHRLPVLTYRLRSPTLAQATVVPPPPPLNPHV
jgi:DNA-binding MarR family transcriptional regulator